MKQLKGITLAPGFANGTAFVCNSNVTEDVSTDPIQPKQINEEIRRFDRALSISIDELDVLKSRVMRELGEAEAAIFDAHLLLIRDPKFSDAVHKRIIRDRYTGEYAVAKEFADAIRQLQGAESPYARERVQDLNDIKARLLRNFRLSSERSPLQLNTISPNTVIVAKDLLPSDTFAMNRKNVAAIITETGGITSHATILCRALGIPKVTGIVNATGQIPHGEHILVDAGRATVVLSPTVRTLSQFVCRRDRHDQYLKNLRVKDFQTCRTNDGTEIRLYANIGRMEEMDALLFYNPLGVGLFRTEYLFLQSQRRPTVDQHFRVYCRAAKPLRENPLVIRTLDYGRDKHPAYLGKAFATNPLFGKRGLSFSLEEGRILRTQLKAIVRAYQIHPNIKVMFPMVWDAEEFQRAIDLLLNVAKAEKASEIPPVGAMIETPSAVLEIESIVKYAEFISIGTNDLAQSVLAIDREMPSSLSYVDAIHPALLKAIQSVVHRAGPNYPISVCGEVAGEPALACILIGLGIRNLSMSPELMPLVHHYLSASSIRNLKDAAIAARNCQGVQGVRDIIDSIHQNVSQGT